ncbi:zinc-ribbon domain-containing protein [Oribacterium sp. FC2011]|uniref:zinc-ribbon domain-containing protein n=1 Tax=Oribacterium sp. FC2011 TaxID=1408311 RepID=UPI0004E24854|nr:zinc-ribbon domain-containing protein [Oribacterium sp. FC2011]
MKCPNCGTELPDNAVFCGKCGLSLGDLQEKSVNTSVDEGTDTAEAKAENGVSDVQESVADASEFFSNAGSTEVKDVFASEASGTESSNSEENVVNAENEVKVEKMRPEGGKPCPNCGSMLPDGAVFCGKCGFSLTGNNNAGSTAQSGGDNVCPNCGTPRKDGASMFCPKCGYKYTDTVNPGFNAQNNTEGAGINADILKKSPKKFIPLIAGLLVILGVVGFFVYNAFFSPKVLFLKMQADLINKTYIEPLNKLVKPYTKEFSSDITFSGNSENSGQAFRNTSAVLKTDLKKDSITLNGLLNYDDETAFDVYLFADKKSVSVSFPSLNGDYYFADLKKLTESLDMEVDMDSYNPNVLNDISDTKKYSKILTRYGKLLTKQMNGKNLTVKKDRKIDAESVGLYSLRDDLKGRYTEYTFKPSEKDLKKYFKDVRDAMKKDKELKELYEAFMLTSTASQGRYGYRSLGDYDDFVNDFMDEIDDDLEYGRMDDFVWKVYATGNKAKFITVTSGGYNVFSMGVFDDKEEHHDAISMGYSSVFEHQYEKNKDGTVSGTIAGITYEDVNLKKQSPFGIYYGKYSMYGTELTVEDGEGRGTDHIIRGEDYRNGKYKFVINATKGSSVKKPSGNKVDVSDYDASDFEQLTNDLGQDLSDYMDENKDIAELFGNLDYYF